MVKPEYWFYHLEASPIEAVLPDLLQKTRERGWTSLVKMPADRLAYFDDYLWTFKDDSFLPHGRDDEPLSDTQPILLSSTAKSSAGVDCVFLLEGEEISVDAETERCLVMIDGRSETRVQGARALWKTLKDTDVQLSYWQQNERGKWEKKA